MSTAQEQTKTMERYYRLQSKIYDATRWSFLFGRQRIIREIPLDAGAPAHMLEVGCGTGYNLRRLARRFPRAHLSGMDVSPDMLRLARRDTRAFGRRVVLIQAPYTLGEDRFAGGLDAILFSYSLTMINPQWSELLEQAERDLRPGGFIAVVDFHDSRFPWFKRHMGVNHVRMDGHLLPALRERFEPLLAEVRAAYGGLWLYLLFVGRKKQS
jgi:S-adenosylmethionine-diacylgycerolhomoserine-N-methlytransferase